LVQRDLGSTDNPPRAIRIQNATPGFLNSQINSLKAAGDQSQAVLTVTFVSFRVIPSGIVSFDPATD
jgi:hypothetical protein